MGQAASALTGRVETDTLTHRETKINYIFPWPRCLRGALFVQCAEALHEQAHACSYWLLLLSDWIWNGQSISCCLNNAAVPQRTSAAHFVETWTELVCPLAPPWGWGFCCFSKMPWQLFRIKWALKGFIRVCRLNQISAIREGLQCGGEVLPLIIELVLSLVCHADFTLNGAKSDD